MEKKQIPSTQNDITPDGNIIPSTTLSVAPPKPVEAPPSKSMEDLPKVDEGEQKTVEAPVEQQNQDFNFEQFLQKKDTSDEAALRQQQQQTPKPVEITPPATARDYNDIEEAHREYFKRMPNDSFNFLKPLYLESKKQKAELEAKTKEVNDTKNLLTELQKGVPKVPENYYSHPDSYVLTPEFSEASRVANEAQLIAQHWTQQLNEVRGGAKEIQLIDRDPRTGQLVYTNKVPANIESESQLTNYMIHGQNQLAQANAKLQSVRSSHGERFNQAASQLQQMQQQFFGQLTGTEENKKAYEPIIQQHLNNLPPAFRNNPMAQLLARSFTANQIAAELIKQANAKIAELTKAMPNQAPVTRQSPTAAEAASDGGLATKGKKGEEVSMDDFEKAKQ